MCRMFLSIRNTSPGRAMIFLNELKRSWEGSAMNSAMQSKPKRIHHLGTHTGKTSVMNTEMQPNNTIRIERGINACWMVLSMKLMLP